MNKPPAFQLYVKDWLSSATILLMPPHCEGAYIRLLCHDWDADGIPDDDASLAMLSRLGELWHTDGVKFIKPNFIKHPNKTGMLTNEKHISQRKVLKSYSSKQSQKAKQRWHKDLDGMPRHSHGIATAKPQQCSASSSASTSSDNTPISPKGDFSVEFETAWKAYPDKSGSKHTAFKAFQKWTKQGDTVQDILDGISKYTSYVLERRKRGFPDLKYKNGQTFFNQRAWKSEYTFVDTKPTNTVEAVYK